MSSAENRAVFLSYASQDADAVRRIADTLRAADVEVWFDQSELVGGDAWDQKIRKQIRDCTLLIAVVSKTTQARREAYFRLEWKLADERTHLMAKGTPFLLPVTIDETSDRDGLVPESFVAVQWTKAPGGFLPPGFAQRVKKILTGGAEVVLRLEGGEEAAARVAPARQTKRWLAPVIGATAVAALGVGTMWFQNTPAGAITTPPAVAPAVSTPSAPKSEVRQKVEQARGMISADDSRNRANLEAADEVARRALALDSTDAGAWAVAARVDALMYYLGYDKSDARRLQAFERASKAMALSSQDWEAREARAFVFSAVGNLPQMRTEAETIYRGLLSERPDDWRASSDFATLLRDLKKYDEAIRIFERIGDSVSAGWSYVYAGDWIGARRVADRELAKTRSARMLKVKIHVEVRCEDLEAAQAACAQLTASELLDDEIMSEAMQVALLRKDSAEILRLARIFPREEIASGVFWGSKREFTGMAHHMAGRPEAAKTEWRLALQQTNEKLKAPNADMELHGKAAVLYALLGEIDEANRAGDQFQTLRAEGSSTGRVKAVDRAIFAVLVTDKESLLAEVEQKRLKPLIAGHTQLRYHWVFDSFRGDPRFEKALRKVLPAGAKPFDDAPPTAAAGNPPKK